MIPSRVYIENFMNHKLSDIDCSLFSAALIMGRNKNNDRESNGVGKTTIFSAIQYALFGVVPTSVLDKVVRDGADACIVIFEFELPNRGKYKITRKRFVKSKRSEVTLHELIEDKWLTRSEKSPSGTDKKITELIKISSNAFKYSVLFAQSDLSGLSDTEKLKSGGRLKVLEEPLNIVKYAKLREIAEKKTRPTKKKIDGNESSISTLGDPKDDLKNAKSDLEYCEIFIKGKENSIDKLKMSIKEKRQAIADLKQTISSDDTSVHDNISQLEERSVRLEGFINKGQQSISKNSNDLQHKKTKVSRFDAEIVELASKKTLLQQKEVRDKEIIVKELQKTSSDEVLGNKLLAQREAEYNQANQSIPKTNNCTVCHQSITSEYRKDFEDRIHDILAQKSADIKYLKANLSKCTSKKSILQEELDQYVKTAAELLSVDNDISFLRHRVETYNDTIKELSKKIEEEGAELSKYQSEHQDVLKRLGMLRDASAKSSVSDVNNKIFGLTDELHVYERSLDNTIKEVSEAKARQGAAEERIKTSTENLSRIDTLKKELQKLKQDYKIQRLGIEALGKRIPKFIVQNILDELQLASNSLLGELRPGLELQFTEELDIFYRVNGQQRDYDQLSIGQKVYIAFSLKLGLAKLIQHKLGVDVQLLLLDEVDQSLDEAGVDAFASIIKKWQDKFKIFIITHNRNLQERIPSTIMVEADGINGAEASVVN